MERIKISVVIPVWNGVKYVRAAVESVINQKCGDWELLIVDDGSTDGTARILNAFARKDNRISVISQEHKGVSAARNAALRRVSGDYVCFLDADDVLHPDALLRMADFSHVDGADIVCMKIRNFESESEIPPVLQRFPRCRILTSIDAVEEMLYQRGIDNSVCGKLFRRTLWDGIGFAEGMRFEDLEVCPKIFLRAGIIASIDEYGYYYRQHPGSFVHTLSPQRADAVKITSGLTGFMAEKHPSLIDAARSREFSANYNLFSLLVANPELENVETAGLSDVCWKKIKSLRKEVLFNRKTRLKNKMGAAISYLGRKTAARVAKVLYRC